MEWYQLAETAAPHQRFQLYWGPPGTGKSTMAQKLAAALGYSPDQIFYSTLTEETPSAELRGMFVPRGGQFVWINGPAIEAWEHGGFWICDEIDKAAGDVFSFCLALLNAPEIARITLPTGRTIAQHPNFRCIATMNGAPDSLPEPLLDRFAGGVIYANSVHPEALAKLPPPAQEAVKNGLFTEPERRTTNRQWQAFVRLTVCGIPEEAAAMLCWGERASDILAGYRLARTA